MQHDNVHIGRVERGRSEGTIACLFPDNTYLSLLRKALPCRTLLFRPGFQLPDRPAAVEQAEIAGHLSGPEQDGPAVVVPAETEEEDLAVSKDQILYCPDRGRRRGIRIEEISADQNSAGMEFPRLPAQPAKCIHELRAPVRG